MVGRTREKKRSKQIGVLDTTEEDKATPKSIIIYRGEVGANVRALMHEWRRAMLPWSSKRLHSKKNTLKDFLHIASTFGVTHLQLFTTPSAGASLRIMRFPAGPTLSLRVESFTLRDDIVTSQKRPAPVDGPAYAHPPVVVLNNFNLPGRGPEVELMEKAFQGMFPSLNIAKVSTDDIQRVVLFQYDPSSRTVEVRHFHITAKAVGISKTVKKLLEGRVPTKLNTLDNIDEVLDREAAWSDTDGEGEEVNLPQRFRQHNDQARIKLVEIGPRMTLSLVKVEGGFAGGEVLYHSHEFKSPQEVAANASRVRVRVNEKKRRRAIQDENVRKKKDAVEQAREDKRNRAAANRDKLRPRPDHDRPADDDDQPPVRRHRGEEAPDSD
jgi:ribosome biogenesis protein SSF1/2